MIESRAIAIDRGASIDQNIINTFSSATIFSGTLWVTGGWHQLGVQAFNGATTLMTMIVIPIGAGEMFVIAGQSNSANLVIHHIIVMIRQPASV